MAKRKAGEREEAPAAKRGPNKAFAFQTPFRAQIVGGSGSGKTWWLIDYLCTYGVKQFDQVIWVAPSRSLQQKGLEKLKKRWGKYITFVEGLNTAEIDEAIEHGFGLGWETCVVLDDLLSESGKSKYLKDLFISGRHSKVSTIELLQAIFPPGARTHRLQTEYFVLFRFAAADEAKRLFQQVTTSAEEAGLLTKAYRKIIGRDPHQCLILDLKAPQKKDFPLRVRDTELDNLVPELWNV